MGTVERNMVPGRSEMLSQGHLLWVGSSDYLLRTLEHLGVQRALLWARTGTEFPREGGWASGSRDQFCDTGKQGAGAQ